MYEPLFSNDLLFYEGKEKNQLEVTINLQPICNVRQQNDIYIGTFEGVVCHFNLEEDLDNSVEYINIGQNQITAIDVSNDGDCLVTGFQNWQVEIYDLKQKVPVIKFQNHKSMISGAVVKN